MEVGGVARITLDVDGELLTHAFDLPGFLRSCQGRLLSLAEEMTRLDNPARASHIDDIWDTHCRRVNGYTYDGADLMTIDDWRMMVPFQHRMMAVRILIEEAVTGGRPAMDPRGSGRQQPGSGATDRAVPENTGATTAPTTAFTGTVPFATSGGDRRTAKLSG